MAVQSFLLFAGFVIAIIAIAMGIETHRRLTQFQRAIDERFNYLLMRVATTDNLLREATVGLTRAVERHVADDDRHAD